MSGPNSSFINLSSWDLYYVSASSSIFRYGLVSILTVGLIGNICQITTFTRKTMRNISTGVLFIALSVSDTVYLLSSIYLLIIYGFQIPDRSNYGRTCQFRHFTNSVATNFSAWMLTTIACDRWFRSRFPHKAQRICTPRTAIYVIIIVLIIDCGLHSHFLAPMFGQIPAGVTSLCSANRLYPSYSYFYTNIWPTISILTVTILPASCILSFIVGIAINVKNSRNRVLMAGNAAQQHERRRARFLQRQMLILMLITVILFFLSTFPVAVYRFIIATIGFRLSFTFSLFLTSILTLIITANYALNFYLHCLTSKLFRKEFLKLIRWVKSKIKRQMNVPMNQQRSANQGREGTVTQLMEHISHIYTLERKWNTAV